MQQAGGQRNKKAAALEGKFALNMSGVQKLRLTLGMPAFALHRSAARGLSEGELLDTQDEVVVMRRLKMSQRK